MQRWELRYMTEVEHLGVCIDTGVQGERVVGSASGRGRLETRKRALEVAELPPDISGVHNR